jgi:general secretion pathway protein L
MGTTSIKAIEVDTAFSRYEIHEYHEQPVQPGVDRAQAAAALIRSLAKTPDRVVLSLSTRETTFRNLQLPTKDKKAIQAGIGFELEDELPFSLENAAFDYCVMQQSRQSSTIHVAATLKKRIAAFLTELAAAGVECDLVTTEAWAYRGMMNRILIRDGAMPADGSIAFNSEHNGPVMLVHFGHTSTNLYVHHAGAPVIAREISWGGADLTAAIGRKYQIPLEQAELAKLDHGFVIPASQMGEATQEQIELSKTLVEPLEDLFRDVRQVQLSCKSSTQKPPRMIYIAGGTALLPGLARLMEEELRIPVKALQSVSGVATSGVTYSEQTDAKFALATSLALCMVGPDRALTVNFRKGDFSKQGKAKEMNFSALTRPLLAAGAVFLCMIISMVVESSVYKGKLKEVDSSLEKSIKSFFGASLSPVSLNTFKKDPKLLRKNILQELGKQQELARLIGPNPHEPIDFLRELSMAIPKETVVELTDFQVGASSQAPSPAPTGKSSSPTETTSRFTDAKQQAKLTFTVANPQMSERLTSYVSGKLRDMTKTSLEEIAGAQPGDKKFKITFSGQPQEDSYGR